jgi:hypothetical protein
VLAVLARIGHIAAIQVLEATIPDNGAPVLNHWDNEEIHDHVVSVDELRRLRTGRGSGIGAARAIGQTGHSLAGATAGAAGRRRCAGGSAAAELHQSIAKLLGIRMGTPAESVSVRPLPTHRDYRTGRTRRS